MSCNNCGSNCDDGCVTRTEVCNMINKAIEIINLSQNTPGDPGTDGEPGANGLNGRAVNVFVQCEQPVNSDISTANSYNYQSGYTTIQAGDIWIKECESE